MATIRDVAREAGVSIATVSRVFNQTALVSGATSAHVREVAARMGYWPNSAARSLITHRTQAIGVLLPDLYGEFFSEVIRGIDLAARREKYQVLVSSTHGDSETLVSAVRALRGRIDGLVVMAPDADATVAIHDFAARHPVVLLSPGTTSLECGALSVADRDGAYAAVTHLASLGHRRIAMVCGPSTNFDAEERRRGYRDALRDAGLTWSPALEIEGDFTEAAGFHAAATLTRLEPRPTAVFAANDYMAVGLMGALRDAEIPVPQELAVCGFDDIAIAQYLTPALTTVRVDAYTLGERAMTQLLPFARARRPSDPVRSTLPTRLVVRGSCGAVVDERADSAERPGRRRHHRPLPASDRHREERAVAGCDGGNA